MVWRYMGGGQRRDSDRCDVFYSWESIIQNPESREARDERDASKNRQCACCRVTAAGEMDSNRSHCLNAQKPPAMAPDINFGGGGIESKRHSGEDGWRCAVVGSRARLASKQEYPCRQ
jgi:hypothetical protein